MSDVPQLMAAETPEDFNLAVQRVQAIIMGMKKLDYDALYDEMSHLNVPTVESASVHVLADQIGKVQAAKSRMSEILVDVEREFRVKNRCSDILFEGWQKFSKEQSTDKRKSDATLRMAAFIEAAGDAECLYKTATRIMTNLDDNQNSISRRVTVFQLLQRVGETFRGTSGADNNPAWGGGASDSEFRDWEKQES